MKMYSNKYSKNLYPFVFGIICLIIFSGASSIPTISPTTESISKTSIHETVENKENRKSNEILFGDQQNSDSFMSDESLIEEKTELESHEKPKTTQKESSLMNNSNNGSNKDFIISSINNNNNNPEEQLTALSGTENNTPSVNSLIKNNAISLDSSDSTSLPFLSSTDSMRQFSNNLDKNNLQNGIKQTTHSPIHELPHNREQQTQLQAPNEYERVVQNNLEANRHKRSYYHNINSLHSNLDDLLNMKRQRRALRYKRNTNYEDFLASLLAAEEAKYNDNYNTYPSLPTNEVNLVDNPQVLYYLLSQSNQDEDSYVDLDKLSKYYYDNILPLLEIGSESDSTSNENSVNQELPVVIEPFAQQVIPVLPYLLPNRYQRIRRSFYNKYSKPLSLYTGLKRKRNHNNYYDNNLGEWGKIVGGKNERSNYEDDVDEANKIYSLATLLATGHTPDQYSQRFKRSLKPVMNIM